MPAEVHPRKVQLATQAGFKRLENFRRARMMFIRSYVGQYYDRQHGTIGTEPLNLIFNAIRVLVPTLVMNFPRHKLETEFVAYREYATNLGLALDLNAKQNNLRSVIRRGIVDAIFMMGIWKTGLCDSGTAVQFDDYDAIDPGTIYTENVDFDNFVFDPACRGEIREASFMGDRIRIPRQNLLESGLYDNSLIERLPSCLDDLERRVESLSRTNITSDEAFQMQEEVEIVELYVPQAKALITVPGSEHTTFDEYLRVADYEGPKEGPYTILSFTPPVPGNPVPVSAVGIWHDLHVMANKMAVKIMSQADRQKDITVYTPAAADDAQELLDASDGEAVATNNPNDVKVVSYGGQQNSNEAHLASLQMWFNMLAANPQAVGGQDLKSDSATEAQILQTNSQIGLEDMKDLVYIAVGEEARKRLFYLHTDPLMDIPIARRQPVVTPFGTQMQDVQVILTPEARRGDWIDYSVEIQPESMGRVDAATRLRRAMEFAVKVLPAAATAAQTCNMMGTPFSFPNFCVRLANEIGITWMDEIFYDPNFQMQMQQRMAAGPDFMASKGQTGGPPNAGGNMAALMQNGQPGNVASVPGVQEQTRAAQQEGAAAGQAQLPVRPTY